MLRDNKQDNEIVEENKIEILNRAEKKTSMILKKALQYSIENAKAGKNKS